MQGRHLSPVQEFGLELLVYVDGHREAKREVEQAGLALVASGRKTLEDLHPEWFEIKVVEAGTPEADAAMASGEAIEDYTSVQWLSPKDNEDEFSELMRLQEELANKAISVADDGGDWQ